MYILNNIKKYIGNNRGASLVIIVAIFALFLVLSMNVIMAAQATTNGLDEEYEAERINMYVSSVHNCISEQIRNRQITGIFESGANHTVTLTGFQGGSVTLETSKLQGKMDATVVYTIPFEGKEYKVQTVYLVNGSTILIKSSSGIISDL